MLWCIDTIAVQHIVSQRVPVAGVHAGLAHSTPVGNALAKRAKTGLGKAPASAPEKRRALGSADENTPVPGGAARRPAKDPAVEIRQLGTLLRAELTAQRNKVTLLSPIAGGNIRRCLMVSLIAWKHCNAVL